MGAVVIDLGEKASYRVKDRICNRGWGRIKAMVKGSVMDNFWDNMMERVCVRVFDQVKLIILTEDWEHD